jgi:hypothetical protein
MVQEVTTPHLRQFAVKFRHHKFARHGDVRLVMALDAYLAWTKHPEAMTPIALLAILDITW